MPNIIALGILFLRSTVLLLLVTGNVTHGKAFSSVDNDEDGSADLGISEGPGIKSLGGVGEKLASSDDNSNLILHNYVDDSSSLEQEQQERGSNGNRDYGWHSPLHQGSYWTLPSSSSFSQRNNQMLTYPSKRSDSSGAGGMESGGDFLTLPQRGPLSPSPLMTMDRSHLLDLPASHSPISKPFSGYRLRPISYNLRGYSATGNGRLSGFLPPISPRKRQILFRQCFFNPISCF